MTDVQDTEPADEEQPSVSETTEDGEAEIDISTLPEQAQAYIHELREESKGRRKENAEIKSVFDAFTANETEYLMDIIKPLGGNDESMTIGAEKMQALVYQILGEPDDVKTDAAPDLKLVEDKEEVVPGLTEEQVREIVTGQTQQDQDVARIHSQTEALGFELDTDGQRALWDLAVSPAINGDLTKAAAALEAIYPELMPEGYGTEDNDDDEEDEEPTKFPASAPASGAGKTAEVTEAKGIPALGSEELRDKVRARMEAVTGS